MNVSLKARTLPNEVRAKIQEQLHLKQASSLEKSLGRVLNTQFKQQLLFAQDELKILAGEKNATAENLADLICDDKQWYTDLIDASAPVIATAMSRTSVAYFTSLGISIQRKSRASDWLDDAGLSIDGVLTDLPSWMIHAISRQLRASFKQPYWMGIVQTTRKHVQRVLDNGLREGLSINEMAKNFVSYFPTAYTRARAKSVARTESGNALNGARDLSYNRMKEVVGPDTAKYINKSWLSVLGNTTRDDHANLDGVEADAQGMFVLGGINIPWPGHFSLSPDQRVNCQCTLTTEFGSGVDLDELQDLLGD